MIKPFIRRVQLGSLHHNPFKLNVSLTLSQITIYDMNEDGTDIDRAILTGLLKGLLKCMVYAYDLDSIFMLLSFIIMKPK